MNYPSNGDKVETHFVARIVVEEVDKTQGTKPQRDKREVASIVVTGKTLATIRAQVTGHMNLIGVEQDE